MKKILFLSVIFSMSLYGKKDYREKKFREKINEQKKFETKNNLCMFCCLGELSMGDFCLCMFECDLMISKEN